MQKSCRRAARAPIPQNSGHLRTDGLALLAAFSLGISALASLSGSTSFDHGVGSAGCALGSTTGGFVSRSSSSCVNGFTRVTRADLRPEPMFRCSLKEGDRVIVASLDTTARWHELQLHWKPKDIHQDNVSISPSSMDVRMLTDLPGSRPLDNGENGVPKSAVDVSTDSVDAFFNSSTQQTPPQTSPPPTQRVFDLPRFVTGPHRQPIGTSRIANCELVLSTAQVAVYIDGPVTDESRTAARAIARHCVTTVLPLVTRELGRIRDLDANGRLTFVLCEMAEASADFEPPILGCVRSTDFAVSMNEPAGDIIYLDHSLPARPDLAAVMAHECAHAAIFSVTGTADEACAMPAWLNEAIAHAVESTLVPDSVNLTTRKRRYLHQPYRYPLIARLDRGGTMTGRGPERAAGLFFAQFVRSQGVPWTALVQASGDDVGRIESALGTRFSNTFRAWTLDLLRKHECGVIDLAIQHLASTHDDRTAIRGTAAMWGIADQDGVLELRSATSARLQVTVIPRTGSLIPRGRHHLADLQ